MHIDLIQTDADYERAYARLLDLMGRDIAPGTIEFTEMKLLGLLLEDYERAHVASLPETDLVDALRFRIDQMGLKRRDLIPFIGSAEKVSEVLARKRPLTLAMIRRLHDGLGIPAEILIQPMIKARRTA